MRNTHVIKTVLLLLILFKGFGSNAQADYFTEEERNWIKAHPIINFGYEPNWPPYEIYDGTNYIGIVGDYLEIVSNETGIQFKPIPNISWEESLDKLRTGEIHFVPSCAVTEKRKEFLVFTETIVSDPLVIVTKRDANFVSSLDYLRGKSIALPRNYYTLELIEKDYPDIKVVQKSTIEECLKAVSTGEVDGFFGSLGVVSYYMNSKGFTNLKIASPTTYDDVQISMACTKDWVELRDICNKVLKRISFREQSEIRQKWIAVRYEYGISDSTVQNYILLGLFIITIIAGFFILWNRSLQKEIRKRLSVEKEMNTLLKKLRQQNDERKILLQEIHHRVKNNLQIIVSMLKLQADSDDGDFNLDDTINRINSISLIHEMIYKSENISTDNVSTYFSALIEKIISTQAPEKKIEVTVKADDDNIGLKTLVPIAIILNELVVNSIKHGFLELQTGAKIRLDFTTNNGIIKMIYRDNGKWKGDQDKEGFGTSLIQIFTEQLDGEYSRDLSDGTVYSFTLHQQK